MKVNYIPTKPINWPNVQSLIAMSEGHHQFTNNGPVKKQLEDILTKLMGISDKVVVCVANGTVALHLLMFMYQKRSKEDLRWLTTAFTFPCGVINGINSVDVKDISPKHQYGLDHNVDLTNYDGLILTNLFGTNVDVDYWTERCRKEEKILIFDNASSPLSTVDVMGRGKDNQYLHTRNINEFGDACFGSLHHTKYLGFGEGGFIVCDPKDYEELNQLANFGFDKDRNYQKLSSNFKMSDINAAFIIQHIEQFDKNKHLKVQNVLIKEFKKYGIEVFNYSWGTVYGNMPILFKKPVKPDVFRDLGIEANKYYKPLLPYPNSNDVYERIINFPLYQSMTDWQIKEIINTVKICLD
jgi:dTDP-4-amino-4,6-dideoxygalactose transaminase